MTTIDQADPILPHRSSTGRVFLAGPAARLWLQTALLLLALMVPTLISLAVDDRQLDGVSVWSKPLKFQLSLALHAVTLALFTSLVSERVRHGRLLRATAWLSAAAAIFETAYITVQAGRGRHSHFNGETAIEAAMYSAMGVGAVILVASSAVVGVLLWRAPRPGTGQALRLAGALGLTLGSLATLIVAGYLSAQGSHWIGGQTSDAGGMAITGWSTSGGDLRVSHFLATHMMQGLPLVALVADRLVANAQRVVVVSAALWVAAVAATFLQALAGQPLL